GTPFVPPVCPRADDEHKAAARPKINTRCDRMRMLLSAKMRHEATSIVPHHARRREGATVRPGSRAYGQSSAAEQRTSSTGGAGLPTSKPARPLRRDHDRPGAGYATLVGGLASAWRR